MANHSAEAPYGYLSYDTIKSWFGITGSQGSYVANQGQEKIPANWVNQNNKRMNAQTIANNCSSTNAHSHTLTQSPTSRLISQMPHFFTYVNHTAERDLPYLSTI
jgi:hypothetical protein